MTDWAAWFTYQLNASADAMVWGFAQIPLKVQNELPPMPRWGTWSPARHIWHVTEYERSIVIPSMNQWLNESPKPDLALLDEDNAWEKAQKKGFDVLTAEFKQVRHEQIEMLPHLNGINWQALRDTVWGPKPLSFIVSKTFQHTYEHGDVLLRMALWWIVESADSQ